MNFFWSRSGSYRKISLETTSKEISSFRRYLPQIIAVVIKNSILLVYGTSVGMPTILIPNLSGSNLDELIVLNQEGISWIASLNHLCVPIGCLLSGAFAQVFGRKRALQFVSLPFLVAFILFYFASESWHVFLGLSLTGLSGGLCEAPALSYAAEVTEPNLRGTLTSTSTLFISLGILFSFIVGTFYPWRTVSIINAALPLAGIVLLTLVPETPYWLITKNRFEEGQKSLAWLRGWTTSDKVEKEFLEIRENIEKNSSKRSNKHCNIETLKSYKEARFIKPFLLILISFIIGHFGISPVTVYAVTIFNLLQVPISSYYATILTGCVNLAGTTLCVVILRFVGKRLLTFISLAGVFVCFLLAGAYAYITGIYFFEDVTTDSSAPMLTWIPLASLVSMGFFSYIMISSLPWILMGEIYYNEIRDVASGFSAGTGYLMGFVANKTFLNMVTLLTLPGVFWFYSGVAVIGFIILYFVLPETEGKTLFEITEHYSGGKKLDNKVLRYKK